MKKGSNTRSGLLWEVERILLELREKDQLPQVLLMENVPDVIGNKNYADFMEWYSALEEMGYQSYYKILNAKNYGIPQNRERCFMVSILGKYSYQFPKRKALELRFKDVLEDDVDKKHHLSQKVIDTFVRRNANDGCKIKVSGYVDMGNNEMCNRVYATEGLSPTIRCVNGGNQKIKIAIALEPFLKIRNLTPLECWRLMGFTDEDFKKAQQVNSNSQLYKQAGNSIVKQVLMAIFKEMMEVKKYEIK